MTPAGIGLKVYRMALSEFRTSFFIGQRRPCVNTLKKWIDNEELPGEVIAGHYFVLVDHGGNPMKRETSLTGNKAADKILARWLQSKTA